MPNPTRSRNIERKTASIDEVPVKNLFDLNELTLGLRGRDTAIARIFFTLVRPVTRLRRDNAKFWHEGLIDG